MSVKVIAIASQKGGVGKTTTVVNAAHGLALKGKEVLVIDFDPQGQVSVALGMKQDDCVFDVCIGGSEVAQALRATDRQRLWAIPGYKRTATAQTVLLAEGEDILVTAKNRFVKPFNGRPDFIVFDTAPSVGGLQEAAMFAADLVIVPAATDYLALFGVTGVLQTLDALRKRGWKGHVIVLPTFFDEITKHSKTQLALLTGRISAMGVEVLPAIHRATEQREATSEGKTIFEYAPTSRTAQEYAALVWKILGVLK